MTVFCPKDLKLILSLRQYYSQYFILCINNFARPSSILSHIDSIIIFIHIIIVLTAYCKDDLHPGPSSPLDSYEAAQSIFPSLARPLQKYLRITRYFLEHQKFLRITAYFSTSKLPHILVPQNYHVF